MDDVGTGSVEGFFFHPVTYFSTKGEAKGDPLPQHMISTTGGTLESLF